MNRVRRFKALLYFLNAGAEDKLSETFNSFPLASSTFKLLNITSCSNTNLGYYHSCFMLDIEVETAKESDLIWRQAFDGICQQLGCDYCLVKPEGTLKDIQLAVFDMDSTLIPMEVIDELAVEAGVKELVAAITESAMRGEIDFNQSFERRLSLLEGMPNDAVDTIKDRLVFNSGVKIFLNYLDAQGVDVGIASGGFEPFAQQLAQMAPLQQIKANRLEFEDGVLTGKAVHPIVNAEVKAKTFVQWQQQRGLEQAQTLAVGDGANDCLMLEKAGLGVAYKAKPYVRYRADCVLQFAEMDALIDILQSMGVENKRL